ncbi:MAG: DUF177 domain-containing protein [bacterium]
MPAPNLLRGSTGIDLHGVPEGQYPLSIQGDSLVVDGELQLLAYRFEGALDWIRGERRLRGSLEGRLRSTCDRCLVPFERELRTEVNVWLVLGQEERPLDPEESEGAALRVDAEGAVLDLAEPFRAAILLEVPIKNLCRGDCRGLCPVCGADRNAAECGCERPRGDPRWDALGGVSFPRNEE